MFLEPPLRTQPQEPLWQRILAIATYIFFWLTFSALGLWLMLVMREAIVELMIFARFNPWAVRGFDRLAIYLLGLIWFITILWIDHYLRSAIGKKRLLHSIARVAMIQAILAAIVFGIRFAIAP